MKENQHIEWKTSWRDEYLKWICGFANAEGGTLVIGKNDRGEVVGVPNAAKLLEDIPNKVRDILGMVVAVNLHHEKGRDLLEIVVEASMTSFLPESPLSPSGPPTSKAPAPFTVSCAGSAGESPGSTRESRCSSSPTASRTARCSATSSATTRCCSEQLKASSDQDAPSSRTSTSTLPSGPRHRADSITSQSLSGWPGKTNSAGKTLLSGGKRDEVHGLQASRDPTRQDHGQVRRAGGYPDVRQRGLAPRG